MAGPWKRNLFERRPAKARASRRRSSKNRRLRVEQLEDRRVMAAANLVISEFMADNDGAVLKDADGDSSDWIEIHNPSGTAASLAARSHILSDRVKAGTLKIVAARYDLDTGRVTPVR